MYIQFRYLRIPELPFIKYNKKGKPNRSTLYRYDRNSGFEDFEDIKPHVRGGRVVCKLNGNGWIIIGSATCSMSDNFSYKIGKDLALLRTVNLGLGHDDLNSGLMFRIDKLEKMTDDEKLMELESYFWRFKNKYINNPNTIYLNPETAEIMPKTDRFTVKTSKIILKNHVWMGIEE